MIKSYFAAWVRGSAGKHATDATIRTNVEWGVMMCQRLRDYLGEEHKVYCPHEHEDLYQRIYRTAEPEQRVVVSAEILRQCLAIVDMADVIWVASDPEHSQGMQLEISRAMDNGIIIGRLWCGGDWKGEIDRVLNDLEDKGLL